LRVWARSFVGGNPTDTLALLKNLSNRVSVDPLSKPGG
jgi:hypothetical protein